MSEVKPVHRYKAQTLFSFGGAKIEYFPHGPEVVLASVYDAQRLLADTAEAELLKFDEGMRALACSLGAGGYNAEILTTDQLVGKVQWGIDNLLEVNERRIAAAEQRIADLKSVLERMLEDDDMPVHWFAQRIDAALNQKSEGESQ